MQAIPGAAYQGRTVYIVDGSRTPFLKAKGKPGEFTGSDLAVAACKALLAKQPLSPQDFDEVVTGAALPNPDEANISRIIALRLGCGKHVPAFTVMRNCASGMQALDNAALDISSGRADLVLAGGCDAMSQAPLIYNKKSVAWFAQFAGAKTPVQKMLALIKLPLLALMSPVIALLRGLTDAVAGVNMGQTAENLAHKFNISRQQMDTFALQSHQRAVAAEAEQKLQEVTTLYDTRGNFYKTDTGVRSDGSLEKLAKLKPVFDKPFGSVTAGNSSQVTDGAAFLILASEEAVKKYQLPVKAKIIDCQWAGLEPKEMGLGPVYASTPLLQRNKLTLKDIDYWEINEAFAAQVLGCIEAWQDKTFCQQELGLKSAFGEIPADRLNVHGGAIAMGHPIGASGARIVLQLVETLRHNKAKRGVAAICIGGGQGGAMLIETCDSPS